MAGDVEARQVEIDKYKTKYSIDPKYRMGGTRQDDARRDLLDYRDAFGAGSYLDVSTGRGEMLEFARFAGFCPVTGTEVVPDLVDSSNAIEFAECYGLPFGDQSVDLVSCFDVLEHLLPGDEVRTMCELMRVAAKRVVVTVNNRPSVCRITGIDMHINIKPYAEWDELIRSCASDDEAEWQVDWRDDREYVSETFWVTRC